MTVPEINLNFGDINLKNYMRPKMNLCKSVSLLALLEICMKLTNDPVGG